ncbi:putative virion structural protein [Serratia phage vB_SmaM-Kodama]|nr:putative virion structural protein [Serratia phage vB_SmaM-Kodama]
MNSLTASYLLDHARTNLWCAPFQDRQVILDLTRISRDGGALQSILVQWTDIPLPTKDEFYHVYQIGNNSSWRTNLPDQRNIWFQMSAWSATGNLITDLYLNNGERIPTFSSYVLRTKNDNLIVAVKLYKSRWNLDEDNLYLRIYNNAFFSSKRSATIETKVAYGGGEYKTPNDGKTWRDEIRAWRKKRGIVNVFVNGVWVDDLNLSAMVTGDLVEWVYDSAVSRIVDFKLTSLPDFTSTLDKTKKYLLHPSKNSHEEMIYYRDDVDVYLYAKSGDGNDKLIGRYYQRNREDSMRMVTHADYSIPTGYIYNYVVDGWTNRDNFYIRLHLRDSGFKRPLINEVNRIQTLYRLDDMDILRAMLGIDATIKEWKVENLEESMYTAIMRDQYATFTAEDVVNAYGYNALAKLFADTPVESNPDSNGDWAQVPFGIQQGGTFFEYTKDGKLLGWSFDGFSDRFFTKFEGTGMVEMLMGHGRKDINWNPSNDDFQMGDKYQYYFFVSPVKNGVITGAWRPAEEGKDYMVSPNGLVTWIHVKARNMGLVLSNEYFLCYTQDVNPSDGIMRFSITHSNQLGTVLPIQPEVLDIFQGSYSLIEGLDYIVEWPVVTVITPRYNVPGDVQRFTIRGMGWETPTVKRRKPDDAGFAYQGILSLNGRFDVRDDKVMRCVVDGKLGIASELPFAENYGKPGIITVPNGTAYSEMTMYVPLFGLPTKQNEILMLRGEESDKRLSDYMTLKYPEVVVEGPNPIEEHYRLFSPLITRLYYEINLGTLTPPSNPKDRVTLSNVINDYLDYLNIDPCRFDLNENYLRIDCHPFDDMLPIDKATWLFFEQVNQVYLRGKLKLNSFFIIKDKTV